MAPHPAFTFCLLAASGFWSGCARDGGNLESRELVSYYDSNGDGKVDLEKHQHPGIADADWELRDENHDGRYEKKVLFGFVMKASGVDLPVAANVRVHKPSRAR